MNATALQTKVTWHLVLPQMDISLLIASGATVLEAACS
jgi:hypothetical protein